MVILSASSSTTESSMIYGYAPGNWPTPNKPAGDPVAAANDPIMILDVLPQFWLGYTTINDSFIR